jgi:hypothetical protein
MCIKKTLSLFIDLNRHHGRWHGYGRLYKGEYELMYDGMFSEGKCHGKVSSFAFYDSLVGPFKK